jgi:hypothetical protein
MSDPITKEGKNLRSTFAVVASFIVVIIIIFFLFIGFGVIPQYSAIAGLVAGAFVVFIIMAMNDKIEKFSLKSPFFEMTSTLKEKIENVQNDVKESKREIGDQIIALNHNIQSIHSRIDTVMTNINLSMNMAIAKQNSTMNAYFGPVRPLSEEIAKQENVEKEIEKETTRIPTKKEIENFVALLMRFSKKSTQDKGEASR